MTVAGPNEMAEIERARKEGRVRRIDFDKVLDGTDPVIAEMAAELEGTIVGPKVVDIGPYCVECREDTTGQEGRVEHTKNALEATTDENGEPYVIDIVLKGWTCEQCQPFESELIEATCQALIERRFDAQEVRRKLRAIGEEKLWSAYHEPMLDSLEVLLGLEIR